MPEPKIARRCPTCGASIRVHAFFCPQCGKELNQPDFSQTLPIVPIQEKVENDAPDRVEPEVKAASEFGRDTLVEFSQPQSNPQAPVSEANKAAVSPTAHGAVGAKIQRATTLARGVEDDVMQRARKVREISGVVLDEAGYDPSLRFVLVAAALFLVFLLIVLLNKFIT